MIRLSCFILFVCSGISAKLIINTHSGGIKGKLVHDKTTGVSYYAYQNIPYAEAPVDDLRFMPPVPKKPWDDVLDATEMGPVCPQREGCYTKEQMSEDCLVYNVYVPANRTKELMPVICVIHGGNFDSLSGNPEPIYGPQLLLRHGNIVVTGNYRIGALGFLSLCNEEASGNAGLKDVILMLKTIQKNIIKFGGDPKKITLSGQEASAAICGYLMLIPEAKSLFHNAIIHSGSVLSTKYQQLSPRRNALALARELKIKYRNDPDLLKQLRTVDPSDMVDATDALIARDSQRGYCINSIFTPTVETDNKYAVIKEPMLKMIQQGRLHDKPILCGINTQEGMELIFDLLKEQPDLINKFNENWQLLLPKEFQCLIGSEKGRAMAEDMMECYMDSYNISLAKCQNFMTLAADWQYNFPMDLFVKLFSQTKKSPAYFFKFGLDSELNYGKQSNGVMFPGCARSDELGYAFLTEVTKPMYKHLSPNTLSSQDFVLKCMSEFAKRGKLPPLPQEWPSAGPQRYHVGVYNSGPEIVHHSPYPERMAFWESLYNDFFNCDESLGSFYCTNDDNHSIHV